MNIKPSLKLIYVFVSVAEIGSMTDTAKVLNVTHSAISQSIKNLELQLGKELFHREGKKVRLNGLGEKYYKEVAPALKIITNATENITKQYP